MSKSTTITVDASKYEDDDDCLTAAAEDAAARLGLTGWDLAPRWADADRTEIVLTVPAITEDGVMSRAEAEAYVRACDEDEGPDTYEEAAEIFEALYGRKPDAEDGDRGQVWSLCCAAVEVAS